MDSQRWGSLLTVQHSLLDMNRTNILPLAAAVLAFGICGSNSRAEDKIDFETKILPLFKERCFDCHQKEFKDPKTGRVKKPKGKFRMDNPELMLQGGEDGSDLVPGDPAKSTVYTSVTLPEEHDDAMPKKGDRLTKEQQDLIKNWIAQGASFGNWKGVEK